MPKKSACGKSAQHKQREKIKFVSTRRGEITLRGGLKPQRQKINRHRPTSARKKRGEANREKEKKYATVRPAMHKVKNLTATGNKTTKIFGGIQKRPQQNFTDLSLREKQGKPVGNFAKREKGTMVAKNRLKVNPIYIVARSQKIGKKKGDSGGRNLKWRSTGGATP